MVLSRRQQFHRVARQADFSAPLAALVEELRAGRIVDEAQPDEATCLGRQMDQLNAAWDQVFPPFPALPWKRRSLTFEYHRGKRDRYLQELLVMLLGRGEGEERGEGLVVNPAAVLGRHARSLACSLPSRQVVATDIDGRWNSLYRPLAFLLGRQPPNYRFVQENVFEPDLSRQPEVVTWFGACGAVTDGCIDYGLDVGAPWIMFRACCHDNIAGNTEIVRRRSLINRFFELKNRAFVRMRGKKGWEGFYFADRYSAGGYPRSQVARELMDSKLMVQAARNSPDSDICRSIIDLDRCLYLQERGCDVLYREELFVASRRD